MATRQLTNLVLPEMQASARVVEIDDRVLEIHIIPLGRSRPCAFLRFGPSEEDPLVWDFFEVDVHDEIQRKGLGRALVKLGADIMKEQGGKTVAACCTSFASLRTFAHALGEPDIITDHDGVPITARELVMAIPAGPVREGDRPEWPSVLARWERT